MTAVEPLVQVRSLHKGYGGVAAVEDVSFDLLAGGSLGIVGESGSGKSTIARMVAGLVRPTAGTIRVLGRPRTVTRQRRSERLARARELQMVFQDPYASLDPLQTAAQAIDEVLGLHAPGERDARRRRVAEIGEMVGLDDRQLHASPRRLSGGQRQRVAIAKALATEPSVLVLDEAVSALDVSIQAQVLNLLNDIREQTGMTYLFITHDLAVVRQVTDDCLVMRRGRVVERGTTESVLDDPQDAYTRRLLAHVPKPGWRPVRHLVDD